MLQKIFKTSLACCLLVLMQQNLFAQSSIDSTTTPKKEIDSSYIKHSPRKAALLSLVPGLGQIYNKAYFKLPIIYGGLGGLTFGVVFNQKYYNDYKDALAIRYDDDPDNTDPYPELDDQDLTNLKNYYRRNRDLCFIGMSALYVLQILDAYVDAQLFYFSVNDNLSMHWTPSANLTAQQKAVPALNFVLTF